MSEDDTVKFIEQFETEIREGTIKTPLRPPNLDSGNMEVWSLWQMFEGQINVSASGLAMPEIDKFIYVANFMGYGKHEIFSLWGKIQIIGRNIVKKKAVGK